MENKILEVIKEVLTEKEVGIVKDIFKENEELKAKDKEYQIKDERIRSLIKELDEYKNKASELNELTVSTNKLSKENKEKEVELIKKENQLMFEKAKIEADTLRYCFEKVFKNTEYRKNYQKNLPVSNGGYISTWNENGSETLITE